MPKVLLRPAPDELLEHAGEPSRRPVTNFAQLSFARDSDPLRYAQVAQAIPQSRPKKERRARPDRQQGRPPVGRRLPPEEGHEYAGAAGVLIGDEADNAPLPQPLRGDLGSCVP